LFLHSELLAHSFIYFINQSESKLIYDGNFRSTDKNGRILEFLPLDEYNPGTYRIVFETKEYYESKGISTFFPTLQITINVVDTLEDYHVPLLLSPFGFLTYRGS
jgi:5-hydroxyisourate hydrolase